MATTGGSAGLTDPGAEGDSASSSGVWDAWTSANEGNNTPSWIRTQDSAVLYPTAGSALLGTVLAMACLFTVVAGVVILTTVALTRRLRRLSAAFLISLISSDVVVGVVVVPWPLAAVIIQASGRTYEQGGCAVLGFLASLFLRSSVFSMTAIAVDRYQAIINCLQYSSHAGLVYVLRGLLAIWLPAALTSLPPLLGWGQYHYHAHAFMCTVNWESSPSFTVFVFCVCYLVPLVVMIFCYTWIVRIARQHVRRIMAMNSQVMGPGQDAARVDPRGALAYAVVDPIKRLSLFPVEGAFTSQQGSISDTLMYLPSGHPGMSNLAEMDADNISSASNTSSVGINLRKEARATVRLLGLVLVYVACWTPYYAVALRQAYKTPTSDVAVTVAYWFALMGSCINPITYALASKRFRHAVKRLCIKSRRRKKNERKDLQKKHRDVVTQIASLYTKASKSQSSNTATSDHPGGYRVSSLTNGTLAEHTVHRVRPSPPKDVEVCWQKETSSDIEHHSGVQIDDQNANKIDTEPSKDNGINGIPVTSRPSDTQPAKLVKKGSVHFQEVTIKPHRLPPLLRKHLFKKKKQNSVSSDPGESSLELGRSVSFTLGSSKPPLPDLSRTKHVQQDTSRC